MGKDGVIFKIIEATVVLVLVYLVVMNSGGFATVMSSISRAYATSVKTLQGR
jgi:hypothetical protein